MFSGEICEIFKNIFFFTEQLWWLLLSLGKVITLEGQENFAWKNSNWEKI